MAGTFDFHRIFFNKRDTKIKLSGISEKDYYRELRQTERRKQTDRKGEGRKSGKRTKIRI